MYQKNPEHSARGLSNLQAESFILMSGQSVVQPDFDWLSLTVGYYLITSIKTLVRLIPIAIGTKPTTND
jgi:hypothetical protein